MADRRLLPLEELLDDLGTAVAFPATPPIAAFVADRLRQPSRRPWLGRPVSRALVLALLATVLLVGIAAAIGIALGGLRVVFGPAPSPLPSMLAGPGLGEPTTLAEARDTVTFLYRERDGFPADPSTNVGLIVTQFRADIGPEVFEKLVNSGVRVTATHVGDRDAWWIAGGEHFFFYRDAQGNVVDTTLRLAGDTLIWEEAGVTHRVEGAPSLADAIRVAESLE